MSKTDRYRRIQKQITELFSKSDNMITRMATINAILYYKIEEISWVGFYILNNGRLQAGPYQGPLACQELEKGKGVCWTGILQDKIVIVPDVHQFPGHIACDTRSCSEIVVPVKDNAGKIIGVLDLDSRRYDRFNETDASGLEEIAGLLFSNRG